jgi:outer membrane protein assembly factor BamB
MAMTEIHETTWPQLRGPTFDSISMETGLADSWPKEGPPLVWTRELGQGYSSFVAVGNRVFTQTQNLYQQSVVCLDSMTGDTVWTHHYAWPYDGGGLYPGPRSTPTWHNGRLYFAAPDGTISCLFADNGKPEWSCNPKKKYRGLGTDFGYASSPVIVDDRLIVPVGGQEASVVALDPRDGSTIWASGESSASYATPLPIYFQGHSLVVTPLENSIALFDVATGKQQWEIEFSQGYDEHSAAPIYKEPFLLVASPFKAGAKCYRLAEVNRASADLKTAEVVSTDNAADSEMDQLGSPVVAWETLKFSNDVASSVLVDGRVYGFDLKDPQSRLNRPSRGEFRCLDFESGRIIWSTNKVGQANIIAADHKLILFTDSGELILAKSGTDEYTELARTQVFQDEICWTYPSLHRRCIYLRTQTRAACFYLGQVPYDAKHPALSVQSIPRVHVLNAKWLVGGEREYPATVPDWIEFLAWYKWSLVGIVFASLVAAASNLLTQGSVKSGRIIFWLTTIVAGVIGSPIINSRQTEYVLLWH